LENPESFSQLEYWMRQIEEEASPSCVKVLVGTKSDRVESRLVKHDDVARFTERYGVKYIETSAKCGLRVD
jgi:GTPase SAR1 family protein